MGRTTAGWRPRNPRGFSTRGPAPPKGRLRQLPADDFAEEDWSRAMETKLPNGCLAKSGTAPTRPTGAQSKGDERHDHDQPMRDRRPFPTMGSEADGRGYALQMPTQGKDTL
jgi:hypothetical protein